MKNCEICGDEFQESRCTQQYCKVCGKNPELFRKRYARAIYESKKRVGDLYKEPVMHDEECIECGVIYKTHYYGKSFCSYVCKVAYTVSHAQCPTCSKLLISEGNETGRGFCSDACKERFYIDKAIERGDYIPCELCGKHFIKKYYCHRFCSKSCSDTYRSAKKAQKEAEYAERMSTIVREEERICEGCGKPFQWSRTKYAQKFCTKKCRAEKDLAKAKESAEKLVEKVKQGSDTPICSVCRTSQKDCVMFTSNFVYLPTGAMTKKVGDRLIVAYCPEFRGSTKKKEGK